MTTLSEIRARLQSKAAQQNANRTTSGGSLVYPHWNIGEGQSTTLRFLPDADPSNVYFWVERKLIKITFEETDDKIAKTDLTIPCLEMWDEKCPILDIARAEYKKDKDNAKALKIWPKKSYLYQGFVIDTPLKEETPPESPLRLFIISPQIQPLIESALADNELDEVPCDYDKGRNFKVIKTSKGGFADFGTSKFMMKATPLTDEQKEIAKSAYVLKDRLPKKPSADELKLYEEAYKAYIAGECFDTSRWGSLLKVQA